MTTESGRRAVLIGISAYEDSRFTGLPAARNSVAAMRDLLVDTALCGWPEDSVTLVPNPTSATEVLIRLREISRGAAEVLLVYYVGHGVLSADGQLGLTLTSTGYDDPDITALKWDDVRRELESSPAPVRAAILDCCFAGGAIDTLAGDDTDSLAAMTRVEGVYTLTATTRNRTAHVPPRDQRAACTSFTGEFRDLIRAGVPGGPERLTFTDLYPRLYARLAARGLPTPRQRGTDSAASFPFAANAALRPGPSSAAPVPNSVLPQSTVGVTWARRLLAEAQEIAEALPDDFNFRDAALKHVAKVFDKLAIPTDSTALSATNFDEAEYLARKMNDEVQKACALARTAVALTMAGIDSDRAQRLQDEAQSIVLAIKFSRASALTDLAMTVVAIDIDRAEYLAGQIRNNSKRADALAKLALAVRDTDRERAVLLLDAADRASTPRWFADYDRSIVRTRIVRAVAPLDLERAARIAATIPIKLERARALSDVVAVAAAVDPDRAELLAQEIADPAERAPALVRIARDLPAEDPDRVARLISDAEATAGAIGDRWLRGDSMARIAETIVALDPERAERLARAHAAGRQPALLRILARVARAMPESDPRRDDVLSDVYQLARSTIDYADRCTDDDIAEIVEAFGAGAADRTLGIAQGMKVGVRKAYLLACIARQLERSDPTRADRLISDAHRLVGMVRTPHDKARALADIARLWA
jgi:hypothetical protein